jgi:hypothetical protein
VFSVALWLIHQRYFANDRLQVGHGFLRPEFFVGHESRSSARNGTGQFGSAGICGMTRRQSPWPSRRCIRLAMTISTRDVGLVHFPAIVIGDHRHRGVGDLGFARAFGLAEIGHADNVVAGSVVRERFGARAERRAFHVDISAAVVDFRPSASRAVCKMIFRSSGKWDRQTRCARRCRARKKCARNRLLGAVEELVHAKRCRTAGIFPATSRRR